MGIDPRKGPAGTAFRRNFYVAKDNGMAVREGICLLGCSCSSKFGMELGFLGCRCGMLWCADRGNLETVEGSTGTTDNSLRGPEKELLGGSPIISPSSP